LIPKEIHAESGITAGTIAILAIPVLAALSSLLTSVISQIRQKKANPNMENQQMMGCMMFTMPLMSGFIAWGFPVGMGMYWILSSLVAFVQTLVLGHIYSPRKTIARDMVEETVYRRSYEKTKQIAAEKADIEE
ncbi:MAG: YidC/Oxa1 family membrane protein insertase, partial [Clostridia bacterium]|nr:YidC/Oxa1 family membrane protein insertase [Clostridia bacterium]